MSLIKAENLSFSYPGSYDAVFDNVSFQIDTDWKLGFIGRNGRGKTTFLKLLLGQYAYSGQIHALVQFDYFPYVVGDQTQMTNAIFGAVAPMAEEWELMRELSYMEVEPDVLYRPFNTLSNGEQTKVLLAALFCNEGHFLLIDEPTNHLDTKARDMVAAYLKRKKGFILVSHDRHFLDGCVDHILSINRSGITIQSGNFSTWFADFQKQQESECAQNRQLKKEIRRLEQASKRSAAWSDKIEASKYGNGPVDRGFIGHQSAKMMKRAKAVSARQQKAMDQKAGLLKNIETAEELKLSPMVYHGEVLAEFSEVAVTYGDQKRCTPVSFAIKRGERIVLEGKNGSGKSSLLKLLVGENIEYTGTFHRGSGLVISYVPQDTAHLAGSLSDFARESRIDESLFKAILRKMAFERVQFEKDMREFSDGQKKKVLIAKSLCEKAHLYVWDEPLNFIDIYSRMQIEALIKRAAPTMVLVEHDQLFRDSVGTTYVQV